MMIEFHLDAHSGVATYLQIVQQVKQALRLGLLEVGDQLPTVREVVAQITINPNTVLKAYRELEREGLVASRPGQGTFVQRTLVSSTLALLAGRVAALVGPNGAGKTTLVHLSVGLLEPTEGLAQVFGCSPLKQTTQTLPRLGFVAQDHPLYKDFSVADLLTLGRKLNP